MSGGLPLRARAWFRVSVCSRRLYDRTAWDPLARFTLWTFRRGSARIARRRRERYDVLTGRTHIWERHGRRWTWVGWRR